MLQKRGRKAKNDSEQTRVLGRFLSPAPKLGRGLRRATKSAIYYAQVHVAYKASINGNRSLYNKRLFVMVLVTSSIKYGDPCFLLA